MPTTLTFDSLQSDLHAYAERAFTAASDPLVYDQIPRLINLAERQCATELKVQGFLANVTGVFQPGVDSYDKPDRWREWVSINMGIAEVFNTVSRAADGTNATVVLDRPHNFVSGSEQFGIVMVNGLSGDPTYNGSYLVVSTDQLSVTYNSFTPLELTTPDTGGMVSIVPEFRTPILPRSYEYLRGYFPDGYARGVPLYYADYDYYHFLVTPIPDRPYPFELNYYELPPMLDAGHQTNWLTDIVPNLLLYASLMQMAPFLKNAEATQTWQQAYDRAAQGVTGQDLDKINDRTSERSKP